MTVWDLITRLAAHGPDAEVMLLEGCLGDGIPRELSLGPVERTLTEEDARTCTDCEGRAGRKVVILGYGCH